MTRTILMAGAVVMLAGMGAVAAQAPAPGEKPAARPAAVPGLTLTTTAFDDGGIIPNKYTMADPAAVSPKLTWTNVPATTVSFALILHDPDVALQKKVDDVLHGMWFNIPGTARELAEGLPAGPTLPDGTIQGKNVRGQNAYMGPGAGAAGPYHHYTFELFALDTKLDLTPDATRADVLKAMDGHILGKGVLVGRFKRPAAQ
jgi:Raf kinase inhibitor-like YbhB/YbcL family protein